MKKLTGLIFLLLSFNVFSDVEINDAPLEWLISTTIQKKINDHGHVLVQDTLIQEIFENINYDVTNDELILTSNKKTNHLRKNLVSFLKKEAKTKKADEKYEMWIKEGKSIHDVSLFRTNFAPDGFYYFNHIHTNISQDNDSLKWLKYSPKETYSMFDNFLRKRKTNGSVAFTDHDTDKAFNEVKDTQSERLHSLRGVEWGGSTHMCLVGIKENWDNLSHGREYEKEESVKQSRSSGGFRIVNHPNRKSPAFPSLSWLDADGVEVWNTIVENAPFYFKRSNNRDAFAQWVDSLKRGNKYTAVSGSDFHFGVPCLRDKTLFYPANYIPATDKENTKKYLMEGRVSFLTRPTAPKLTLRAKFKNSNEWAHMGEKISGDESLTVELFGDFSDTNKKIGGVCYNVVRNFYKLLTFWKKENWEVRFYNLDGDVIAKRAINPKKFSYKRHFRALFDLNIKATDLVRAELWSVNKKSKSVDLLGATNPIYINW